MARTSSVASSDSMLTLPHFTMHVKSPAASAVTCKSSHNFLDMITCRGKISGISLCLQKKKVYKIFFFIVTHISYIRYDKLCRYFSINHTIIFTGEAVNDPSIDDLFVVFVVVPVGKNDLTNMLLNELKYLPKMSILL